MIDQAVISFAIFEDGREYLGMAQVTLPTLNNKVVTINGAGIAGDIEAPVTGQVEAMEMTLNFRTPTAQALSLTEQRRHQIELRAAIQEEDPVDGTIQVRNIKHVLVVVPKSLSGGTIAPATEAGASGTYSVRYWAQFVDGTKMLEVDPFNFIYIINGKDYLEPVRKALGRT